MDLAESPLVRLTVPGGFTQATVIGDMNGDGHSDLAYADPGADTAGLVRNGMVRVVLGPVASSTDPVSGEGFTITGPESNACAGADLASGDVNGDGLADL